MLRFQRRKERSLCVLTRRFFLSGFCRIWGRILFGSTVFTNSLFVQGDGSSVKLLLRAPDIPHSLTVRTVPACPQAACVRESPWAKLLVRVTARCRRCLRAICPHPSARPEGLAATFPKGKAFGRMPLCPCPRHRLRSGHQIKNSLGSFHLNARMSGHIARRFAAVYRTVGISQRSYIARRHSSSACAEAI